MAIVYHQCLSQAGREGVGHSVFSSKPGIISIINQYNLCLSKDMRSAGPGDLLEVLSPQLVFGNVSGHTSGLLPCSEHIPVHSPEAALLFPLG